MATPESDQKFGDDLIQSDGGRYGIGGNTGDGRFGPMPTGIVGDTMRSDVAIDGAADTRYKRADASFTRNVTTRPTNRVSDRR